MKASAICTCHNYIRLFDLAPGEVRTRDSSATASSDPLRIVFEKQREETEGTWMGEEVFDLRGTRADRARGCYFLNAVVQFMMRVTGTTLPSWTGSWIRKRCPSGLTAY